MAKPNKTVAKFRRKNPFQKSVEESSISSYRRNPEFWEAMKAFQEGKMSAEEFRNKFENKS